MNDGKLTQKELVLKRVAAGNGEWVPSHQLQSQRYIGASGIEQWLGTSGDRRARELVEEGVLVRKRFGKFQCYRLAEPKQTEMDLTP